jgi:hypothetical protein
MDGVGMSGYLDKVGCRVTYARGGAEYSRAKRMSRLTTSHRMILAATTCSESGLVRFVSSRPTQIQVEHDSAGRVVVTAVGSPERFLLRRGLIEETSERRVYRITDKGREAVGGI